MGDVAECKRLLPKKTDFATIIPDQLNQAESLLNNRFLKDQDYKTPGRSFAKMLNVLCECSTHYSKEVRDE